MENIIYWTKNIITIIGFIVTIFTWIIALKLRKEAKRLKEPIQIILISQKGKILVPYAPRRSQLNRAELLGVLGMYSKSGRFTLSNLSEIFTGGLFEQVLAGKINKIEVHCSDEEITQF